MTPEGKVKHEVKKILKKHGVYYFMPVQSGYGKQGLDFHCCHVSIAFFIETKAAGKKLTPRQELTVGEIQDAGGEVFVVDGTDDTDTYENLDKWIVKIKEFMRLFKVVTS